MDVIQAAQRQGQALTAADFAQIPDVAHKQRELVHRLLRYVDNEIGYAVRALSACRAFNRHIYDHLGQSLRFHATSAAFETLTRFSFVWPADERGEGWYRIHDLLRRLFGSQNEPITHQAHTVLEAYHRQQANEPTAQAYAIYHANRLEWQRGVNEWVERFDKALELSHYDLCGTLLNVRHDLSIESDFQLGRVSDSEGQYFAELSRHAEARQEYQEAITAYDEVLRHAPDDVVAHNGLGLAYLRLGELQASLSEHSSALASLREAIAAYHEALRRAPDDVAAHHNQGVVYLCLGELQASRSEHHSALVSLREAIAAYDEALHRAPDYVVGHNNQGLAYQGLGELQIKLGEQVKAVQSFEAARAACKRSLEIAPNDEKIRRLWDDIQALIEQVARGG